MFGVTKGLKKVQSQIELQPPEVAIAFSYVLQSTACAKSHMQSS